MREESSLKQPATYPTGITPAHAGRILIMKTSPLLVVGSPPRMREELELYPLIVVCNGITPAHAGRIRPKRGYGTVYKDHPRACGKNTCAQTVSTYFMDHPRACGKNCNQL